MPRVSRRILTACALLAAAFAPACAEAACTVGTVAVSFGSYDPTSATADDGTGAINVTCKFSDGAPTIALGPGGSGNFATSRMTSGPWNLRYNLFTTAARNLIWGDGTAGTLTLIPTGIRSGGNVTFSPSVYGRIPALQNVGAGTYADSVVVTVSW